MDDNNPNKNGRKDSKTIAALVNEGGFLYPYIPTGICAEIQSLFNPRLQTQEEITRIKNRIARWFSVYFSEIKDVYKKQDSVSGLMVLKVAPRTQDIVHDIDGHMFGYKDEELIPFEYNLAYLSLLYVCTVPIVPLTTKNHGDLAGKRNAL